MIKVEKLENNSQFPQIAAYDADKNLKDLQVMAATLIYNNCVLEFYEDVN